MKKTNLIKRILAYTLVLSVIFSQMIFASSAVTSDVAVWDGTKAETFAGGDGTAASPFLIETAEQLYKMVVEYSTTAASEGKYFEITNDIYLNNVADGTHVKDLEVKENWLKEYGTTALPNGSKTNAFAGSLNGNGHTIYGLYTKGAGRSGLFHTIIQGTIIKNIHFENVYLVDGKGYGGAIAGRAHWVSGKSNAKITNCSVNNAIIGGDMEYSGGLIGNMNDCNADFTNCYSYELSLSNWTSKGLGGGIFGNIDYTSSNKVTLTNCYSAGNFVVNSKVNKTKGAINCNNVYTNVAVPDGNSETDVIVLTDDQMKGKNAKANMAGFDFGFTFKTVENGYPVLSFNEVWDGSKATNYAGGSGTENDPYLISNGAQLYKMVYENTALTSDKVFTEPKYFKVIDDIYLNAVTDADMLDPTVDDWDAKGYRNWYTGYNYKQSTGFCGNIDGDGHIIYGLYNKEGTYAGFLPNVVDSATVTNLHFKNAFVRGSGNGGPGGIIGIVNGVADNRSTATVSYCSMDNCYIFADATGSWRCGAIVGGGVGEGKITVTNCVVTNIKMKVTNTGTPNRTCAFIGNTNNYKSHEVSNCFTDASAHPVTDSTTSDMYDVIHGNKVYTNVYTSAAKPDCDTYGDIIYLTEEQVKGENAKTNMPALDFVCVWQTVENDYPVLRENILYGWDGTAATEFAGGEGTQADPYLIENGGQLYKMVAEYSNASVTAEPEDQTYFKITKDINLGNKQWYTHKIYSDNLTNANYKTGFNGVVYGAGHTIYGLTVIGTNAYSSVGLIPVATQGAEIYDLHLESGKLTQTAWNGRAVGAFIGLAVGTENSQPIVIEKCSVKDFDIESENGSAAFVAYSYSQSITIRDSYCVETSISNTGTDANSSSGAFIAVMKGNEWGNNFVIENSHCADVAPTILANDNFKAKTTFENVYTSNEDYDGSIDGLTKLTVAEMTGVAARENMVGLNFNQIWQYGAEGEYPVHKTTEENANYWNGTVADNFAGGEGTAEKPYEISNAEELLLLAKLDTKSTAGKYYKLTSNIQISRVYEGWETDSPYSWTKKTAYLDGFTYANSFAGTLDGAGYTVSGLYYDDEITDNGTYAYGLIPFVSANAIIKNITVTDVVNNVDKGNGTAYVGAVVGASHVTEEDIANAFKMVQFVGVNAKNSNAAILGGASRGVKFELCNADKFIGSASKNISIRNCNSNIKYTDDVLIYNSLNADSTTLTNTIKVLLGTDDKYITDINGDEAFDLKDLVSAKKGLVMSDEPDGEYKLAWSQDFNGDSIDYSVWTKNSEMGVGKTLEYVDDNTSVNGGNLKFTSTNTGRTNENGEKIYGVSYGLSTVDTMSFKYGKIEMRAKLPFAAGAWPSLWLTSRGSLGYDSSCDYSTEIDIFEIFGNNELDLGEMTNNNNQMVACIHKWYNDENGDKLKDAEGKVIDCSCGTTKDKGNSYYKEESERSKSFKTADEREAFHTIVFEWTEDAMIFTVDGDEYFSTTREEMEGKFGLTDMNMDATGIFEQFLCIRLNNHMISSASNIDTSKLNYEIDYIKLYQKNDGKSEINLK